MKYLLSVGDIISLMAGDITPGKVYELLPEELVYPDENARIIEERNNREILMRLEYEDGEGKEGGKGKGVGRGLSWSNRDNNGSFGIKQTINPILHFPNKIRRNEKIMEKGTKIHLRVRTKSNNYSMSNHMMKKNNQSDSDISFVMNNKDDRLNKDTHLHKSKLESPYTKVCYDCHSHNLRITLI